MRGCFFISRSQLLSFIPARFCVNGYPEWLPTLVRYSSTSPPSRLLSGSSALTAKSTHPSPSLVHEHWRFALHTQDAQHVGLFLGNRCAIMRVRCPTFD